MKTHSIHSPYNRGRSRAALFYAHLVSFMLASSSLHAQTQFGQQQLSPVPTEFQMNLIPTESPERIRLAIDNPRKKLVRIQFFDQQGRSYYEAFDGRPKMIIPFDVSSVPPGTYTVDVSTTAARQKQTFVVEPPAPRRVRLHPDRSESDWLVTTGVEQKHR